MPIRPSLKIVPLALGGLVMGVIVVLVLLFILRAWWSTPILGFNAGGPDQPIAFPHDVHVQQQGIQCEFCHRNVTIGDAATVPAVEQCLFCHKTITGTAENTEEIAKLLAYGGLDAQGKPDPSGEASAINWERVHRLPDHVQFVHEAHLRFFTTTEEGRAETIPIAREVNPALGPDPRASELVEATCTICHGKVREMTKVKQERSLKMGDCVDCHRDYDAPTDCTTCHY